MYSCGCCENFIMSLHGSARNISENMSDTIIMTEMITPVIAKPLPSLWEAREITPNMREVTDMNIRNTVIAGYMLQQQSSIGMKLNMNDSSAKASLFGFFSGIL